MADEELAETIALLKRLGGPGIPVLMIAGVAQDARLSFASMSECMTIGIAGGCGLACPVLHQGRCKVEEDFREDALAVLEVLAGEKQLKVAPTYEELRAEVEHLRGQRDDLHRNGNKLLERARNAERELREAKGEREMKVAPEYALYPEALRLAVPPFSFEYIAARIEDRWRIRDSRDDAVGHASTPEGAQTAVDTLNGVRSA